MEDAWVGTGRALPPQRSRSANVLGRGLGGLRVCTLGAQGDPLCSVAINTRPSWELLQGLKRQAEAWGERLGSFFFI